MTYKAERDMTVHEVLEKRRKKKEIKKGLPKVFWDTALQGQYIKKEKQNENN